MKKLNSSRSSKVSLNRSLPSIEITHPLINRDRLSIPCAFHVGQKITNFCKDPNCLLPLCPKCVKIHSEQHQKIGIFSSFHTIDQCLQEAHQQFIGMFSSISKLQQMSFQIEDSYRKKKQQVFKEFNNAKIMAHEYLDNILKEYEEGLKLQIAKDDRQFSQSLILYHQYIADAMQKCKNGSRKMSNKALIMEGLINYYSHGNIRQGLDQIEAKLSQFMVKKITIDVKEYELERLVSIMKRYITIGDGVHSFENLIVENKMMKTFRTNEYENMQCLSMNSPRSLVKESRKIEDMRSPLDQYSLERSRNVRLRLDTKQ